MRAVDWPAVGRPRGGGPPGEGLRARKKRLTRRRLAEAAAEMFLERGFDAVRVAEIAQACGVSEKTVFNYFPTKESLLLDLGDATGAALRTALADPDRPPLEAVLEVLAGELAALTCWLAAQPDQAGAAAKLRRFRDLTRSTPSLRAHHRDTADRLTELAAALLAARTAGDPAAPEPQIAAAALLGLWRVQCHSLGRHLAAGLPADRLRAAVTEEVRRAARVLAEGLG
ncbi:helix-turn-helix domain-containing protein [Kitasatospora sp. NPDC006697]|uniref:TetR/AcrR family transcriptional regulator n=1 Tax=Kitasatospora sp. NPDC006697 TaxID=3364020 RepID=UPI0036CF0636